MERALIDNNPVQIGEILSNSHKSLRELYHNRLPLYKNCAQIIINTDGLTVSQTIKKILSDIN